MKKEILIGSIIAVAILIGVSFTSVVGYNAATPEIKHTISTKFIDHFVICFISGNYKTKTSNDEYQLILESGDGNKTMKVKGIAIYLYGEFSGFDFYKIQVWNIKAKRFIGISYNGFVFGIGLKEVYVQPDYIPPYH
ncbi:MAG: hypothetical protein JSW60_06660 [Thermoplasmatales archaeon]|nr:MAG: hypothetical protein JSW60_06660 [Thermoplasmatales archaeon]